MSIHEPWEARDTEERPPTWAEMFAVFVVMVISALFWRKK
jgi:hypothetical protein